MLTRKIRKEGKAVIQKNNENERASKAILEDSPMESHKKISNFLDEEESESREAINNLIQNKPIEKKYLK
jgi:hypothetical protein